MFRHHFNTPFALVTIASIAVASHGAATTNFADLPDGVYVDIGLGNPVGPFGPFEFELAADHIVTATLVADAMSCPDNIGSHGEIITEPNDPLIDPGDSQGRFVVNSDTCPNQSITLDFSEPVPAVGVTIKHYSCGFLQQGNRTIQAFDAPGGTGNLIGSASTVGFAFPCFAIWLDFIGVVSDQPDIQSLVILADSDETLITGIAASPGPAVVSCPADTNGDNEVNVLDLLDLLGHWGACDECPQDLNNNGAVDVADLLALLGQWGPCP